MTTAERFRSSASRMLSLMGPLVFPALFVLAATLSICVICLRTERPNILNDLLRFEDLSIGIIRELDVDSGELRLTAAQAKLLLSRRRQLQGAVRGNPGDLEAAEALLGRVLTPHQIRSIEMAPWRQSFAFDPLAVDKQLMELLIRRASAHTEPSRSALKERG